MEQEIDVWIEQLSQCKQLSEADVKKLCDKVCLLATVHDLALILLFCTDKRDPYGRIQCSTS